MAAYGYDDLSQKLIEVIPELRPQYEELLREWGPPTGDPESDVPGQYIVYGDLLNPLITKLLHEGNDQTTLRRFFALLEELAVHPDPKVSNLVAVGILEAILLDIHRAWEYMGPETRRLYWELEEHRRRMSASYYSRPTYAPDPATGGWSYQPDGNIQPLPTDLENAGNYPSDIFGEVRAAIVAVVEASEDPIVQA